MSGRKEESSIFCPFFVFNVDSRVSIRIKHHSFMFYPNSTTRYDPIRINHRSFIYYPNLNTFYFLLSVSTRLNAQIDDDEVHIFNSSVLPRVIGGESKSVSSELFKKHPKLIFSRMIVFPIEFEKEMTIIVVVNPAGVFDQEYRQRSSSFMLSLHPGNVRTRPDLSVVSRRIRLFLNNFVAIDPTSNRSKKFSSLNFKIYAPEGKLHFYLLVASSIRNKYKYFSFSYSAKAIFSP